MIVLNWQLTLCGAALLPQAPLEKLVQTLLQQESMHSISIQLAYEVEPVRPIQRPHLFAGPLDAPCLSETMVPSKNRFVEAAHRLATARKGRKECSVNIDIGGQYQGEEEQLLEVRIDFEDEEDASAGVEPTVTYDRNAPNDGKLWDKMVNDDVPGWFPADDTDDGSDEDDEFEEEDEFEEDLVAE